MLHAALRQIVSTVSGTDYKENVLEESPADGLSPVGFSNH